MSETKRKVPKLRFPGFTEDWEQRKLGECSVIITGGTPSTRILEYWSPKEIPWMSSGEINKKRISKTDDKISKLGLEQSSARWVKKNSVLIALAGQGKTRGTVAINEVDLTTNQSIAAIELDSVFNTEFVFQNLDSRYDELRKESSGDGTRGGLNKKIISDLYIPYTEYKEQDIIGGFLKKFDNLITLHQRKLENLKLKKKALLQKFFPKNGEQFPELRFPGFTDAWEQRKLGEIIQERNEQQVESSEYPLMSFVQGIGVTPKGERYDRSFLVLDDSKKYKKTELGDFIYSSNNLESGSIGINKTGKAVISPVYSIFYGQSVCDSQFIGIMSLLPSFIAAMVRYRQGVVYGQWKIHERDFLALQVYIPKSEEREKIIKLILDFDNLITLHQRKLEHLQLQKKALLQQMFV